MYSISTFTASSHSPETSFTFLPIPSNADSEHGAAYFFSKDKHGEWYLPEFEDNYSQNPIVGGSENDHFGASVAINDEAFVVGAPYAFYETGEATAYSYELVTYR